ncbi:hypothetical protein [Rhodococcus rhodochrous]|uniref:hypothetical protein n=1 Tax=Rhodococcus rhodochrous TaxID=1829 RepID=UPI00128F6407|nr:hypothetical protein [Rhodococcus rhodochrous]
MSTLVRAPPAGQARARKALAVRPQTGADVRVEPEVDLGPSYYERGTVARRRDHKDLKGLTGAFDEIDARAGALFDELLMVLEGM